jgi:hypothetical protein
MKFKVAIAALAFMLPPYNLSYIVAAALVAVALNPTAYRSCSRSGFCHPSTIPEMG